MLLRHVYSNFQAPANRWGNMGGLSAGQLKVTQEVITLAVFARLYLGEHITWNYYVAFALVVGAVFFVYHKW
ncbi:MAG TPA: DMT family protein [Tepidisphaeraceae bacterium]|jgi:uncharacterized protein (DUF486 family)|nr:DMT family protein [Tepidisphaeraceae bacterium]